MRLAHLPHLQDLTKWCFHETGFPSLYIKEINLDSTSQPREREGEREWSRELFDPKVVVRPALVYAVDRLIQVLTHERQSSECSNLFTERETGSSLW